MKTNGYFHAPARFGNTETPSLQRIEKIDGAHKLSIQSFSVSPVRVAHMKRPASAQELTRPNFFCCRHIKIQCLADTKNRAEYSWQNLPVGENQNRQEKILSECRTQQLLTQQSAASAAVHNETGNFDRRTALEVRPEWGVPKAFLLGHTSACCGA
jgi:hypothetical protein